MFYPIIIWGKVWYGFINPFISNISLICRYFMYSKTLKSIGINVSIHRNVTIKHPENITLGDNVSIHTLCYIDGGGGLTVGNNVSIAHNCSIITFNHSWDNRCIPIKYNQLNYSPIKIHDDVWIGAGVRIMPGVTIANRCIIGAGSVVTKDCEPNSIYAGIPAHKIRSI